MSITPVAVPLLHGDGREGENPQAWFRIFQNAHDGKDEATLLIAFGRHLYPGDEADQWWDEKKTITKTWTSLETRFEERWPKVKVVKRTKDEYENLLLNFQLKEEELGTMVDMKGVQVYSHVKAADTLFQYATGMDIHNTAVLISSVHKNLPKVFKDKLDSSYGNWKAFTVAIKDMDPERVKEAAAGYKEEKEKERKDKEWKEHLTRTLGIARNTPESPTKSIARDLAAMNLGGGGGYSRGGYNGGGYSGYGRSGYMYRGGRGATGIFGGRGAAPGQRLPSSVPLSNAQKNILRQKVDELKHHPKTAAGIQEYEVQKAKWVQNWGNNLENVTYEHPYPLRPGTAGVCTGECFSCGKHGHQTRFCPEPTVDLKEKLWRRLCYDALGVFRRGPDAIVAYVSPEIYAGEYDSQGNEEGPSV
ncbi:hypothetical protein VKT23_010230 [Stygiomarasmius scandens]|uniref:CCHC-type domain-containing protein n=1 Tax=Marasmiellus scandens TaxID=2682957 RepID=A0ABR1JF24_9AGAR